ncbi:MAG: hypothetical protein IPP34_05630 [Bacteroidetes bacterium]|nr:hypothetical protein [Bacteroidota bacterium]
MVDFFGRFSDSNISGDKTQNSYGTYDYWIAKIDSAGSVQWDITYGGSEDDAFKKMFPTADGGYILTGDSNSPISGIKTVGPGFWMIKINATGGIEWQRTEINIVSFIQTMDGGYLFYKISYSSLPDYQIVKTDSSFNLQWQKYYRGNSYDYIRQVAESPNGGFLVCGVSRSILKLDKTEPAYGTFNYDYWIILIDEIGGIISQNTIGGFDDEDIISVVEDANEEFAVGGGHESNLSGDKIENTKVKRFLDYKIV